MRQTPLYVFVLILICSRFSPDKHGWSIGEDKKQLTLNQHTYTHKYANTNPRNMHRQDIIHGTSGKPFSCPSCGKGLLRKIWLDRHLQTKACERSCVLCEKYFKTRLALREHRQTHVTKTYTCQIVSCAHIVLY